MPVTSLSQSLSLTGVTNYYLNHPAYAGISDGYWYYYSSSAANNTLAAKIKPHRWGTALNTNEADEHLTLVGTLQLVSESLNKGRVFHGGSIARSGPGTNVQTGLAEDDGFFFYHLGDLRANDNVGYWDYAYLAAGATEWDYFQYHQHNPNVYENFYEGRTVHNGGIFINSADKRYAHIQPTNIADMGTDYTNVLLRVHQPSQGGAHNSHTDIELGAVANKNYMIGGTIAGTSNRFHAFYLAANGTDWDVFSRTFVLSSNAVTAEENLGTFNLADPDFTTTATTGLMQKYPVRASAGALFGTECYIPVLYTGATASSLDVRVWKFTSADRIIASDIVTQSLVSGLSQRPDVHITSTGTKLTAVVTDIANGGVDFYTLSGSTWTNEGNVLVNGPNEVMRIHGFDFNTQDSKYYILVSGDITGSVAGANYSGSGVYSFSDGVAFTGYKHLAFTSSYGFITKNPLETGYVKYNNANGVLYSYSTSEPQSIAETEKVLIYDEASPKFHSKTDTKLGGDEFYFHGIKLNDGRLVGVGNVDGNIESRGGYDLVMAIYGDGAPQFFGYGGSKDDYFTGVIEDVPSGSLWLVGYTKSYLAQIRDIKIHPFGRGLLDGTNKLEWVDMAVDSDGNQYYAGNHLNNSSSLVAKYDYNFNVSWSVEFESSQLTSVTDQAYGITLDSSNNAYVIGTTNGGGAGSVDAYVAKFNTTGSLVWSKFYGTTGAESKTSIATVTKNSTEYLVTTINSGSNVIVNVLDTNGLIVEQNRVTGFTVNRVRKSDTETNGFFLLAGKDNSTPSLAKFAKGQVLASGNMIQWVFTYTSGSFAYEATDIRNTEADTGNTGIGSLTGPRYHVIGTEATRGFIMKMVVDQNINSYSPTKTWATNLSGSVFAALTNTTYNETPSGSRSTYVVGYTSSSLEGEGGWEGLVAKFDYTGTGSWVNTLGHTSDEKLFAIEKDVTNDNIITAGWSESHTTGRRTMLFRSEIGGFGNGNAHEQSNPGMAMWYQSSSLSTAINNGTITTGASPSNIAGGLTATSGSFTGITRTYTEELYDGGNLWDMFIAKVDLNEIAKHKNSETHQANQEICNTSLEYVDFFEFYQCGTVGDGSADDGNWFGYDLLKMSGSGDFFVAGQVSGDVTKRNLGNSGVYDYIVSRFNYTTKKWEHYQNGTNLDEEIYACTELSDGSGSIAFVGRTAGNLGGDPQPAGGYDIFLGIYNPITDAFRYYSTGSGQNDRAVNVHDIGGNQMAIVFESAAPVSGSITQQGGFDIGVFTFNYSTNTWVRAYQTGTKEDETLSQDGKPSVYLTGSNRVAIVGKTLGIFSDEGVKYGDNDMFLGILDLNTGSFTKYQIGTGANDTATTVFNVGGDVLVVGGFSDASFEEPNNGIFVFFDASKGIKGKG